MSACRLAVQLELDRERAPVKSLRFFGLVEFEDAVREPSEGRGDEIVLLAVELLGLLQGLAVDGARRLVFRRPCSS